MREQAITKVINALRQPSTFTSRRIGFNMMRWYGEAPDNSGHSCGTVACLAGWVLIVHGISPFSDTDTMTAAAQLLELSEEQAEDLFLPITPESSNCGPKDAARVLAHLLATGDVDWER